MYYLCKSYAYNEHKLWCVCVRVVHVCVASSSMAQRENQEEEEEESKHEVFDDLESAEWTLPENLDAIESGERFKEVC